MTSTPLDPHHPAYPPALAVLAGPGKPPPTLYVRGTLPSAPGVAIVGTRRPSSEAVAFTRTLAAALVSEGFVIWSGGAAGIDAAAHEAALAAGGTTVVVAGGGLDRPYPSEHRGLFDRVMERGGALVARVPDGTPPMAPWFLQRNEVLAALSTATVVVEAGFASGARSTAAAARRLGRPLCVVPHPPWSEKGAGCALELSLGASPVSCVGDVLAALGRPPPPPVPRIRRKRRAAGTETLPLPSLGEPEPLDAAESAVLAALDVEPRCFDEACERAGLPAGAARGALLTLTLRAAVVEGPAGFFRRPAPSCR